MLDAVKLAPDLVPAAALAGRRLAEAGEPRKARKILEKAWTINPHPDIAESYANLRFGDSARERLARMQKLADKVPGQLEGALAVARAALDAREFAAARAALAPYLSAPTRRVAALMAEIEEAEHGDEGRVREWMARAMRASGDPVWTADGVVSDRWLPVSPNGRLDGFEWKVPLAEIGVSRPVIEAAPPAVPGTRAAVPEAPPVESRSARPQNKAGNRHLKPAAKARPVEPVIPLVHAPDDPGLDPGLDRDPVPEASTPPPGTPGSGCGSCSVKQRAMVVLLANHGLRRYLWRSFSRRSSAVEHPLRKRVVYFGMVLLGSKVRGADRRHNVPERDHPHSARARRLSFQTPSACVCKNQFPAALVRTPTQAEAPLSLV